MTANPKIDLWFGDECHFQQHGTRCRMWIPPETTDPVLLHAPTRKSMGIIGAVRPSDGQLMTCQAEKFNCLSFGDFVKQLYINRRRNCKMVIVLDNASWHHAVKIKPNYRRWLKLDFIPPYSPELNPIERVWKLTRRICTHNRYFPNLDELVETVSQQLDLWSEPNQTLQRLCASI